MSTKIYVTSQVPNLGCTNLRPSDGSISVFIDILEGDTGVFPSQFSFMTSIRVHVPVTFVS